MKKLLTASEACKYLLNNTVKTISYNTVTSEMTITYNDEDRLVTETFVVGGDTSDLEQAITDLQENKQDKLTAGTNITITQVGDDLVISASGGGDNAVEKSVAGSNETSTIERTMSGSEPINLIAKLKYVLSAMYPNIGCHSTIKQGGDTLSTADRIAVVIDSQSTQYDETAHADRLVAFATDKVINVNVNGGKYIKTVHTGNDIYNEQNNISGTGSYSGYTIEGTDKKDKTLTKSNYNDPFNTPVKEVEYIEQNAHIVEANTDANYKLTITKDPKNLRLRFEGVNPLTSENYDVSGLISVSNGMITMGGIHPLNQNLKTIACKMTDTSSGDVIMFNIIYDSYFTLTAGDIKDAVNGIKLLAKKISNGVVSDVLFKYDSHNNESYTYDLTAPSTVVDTYNYNLSFFSIV